MTQKNILFLCLLMATSVGFGAQGAELDSDDPFTQLEDDIPLSIHIGDQPLRTNGCEFATQIVPILDQAGAIEIFKDNLFVRTAPLNHRNTLDLPILYNWLPRTNSWAFNADFFFNQTTRNYFSKTDDNISGSIGFKNSAFVGKFEHVISQILTQMDVAALFMTQFGIDSSFYQKLDIRKIAGLVGNATVSDRRLGFLLEIAENRERWSASVKLPVQYLQRNYWVSFADQKALRDLKLIPEKTGFNVKDAISFAREHLIGDTVGIGDTRITVAYQPSGDESGGTQVGGFVTIPTETVFKRGIVGNGFTNCRPGYIDLCGLLNLAEAPDQLKRELKTSFDNLAHAGIDRVSGIYLENQAGQRKHWGLGLFLDPEIPFGEYIRWRGHLFYEFVLPGNEQRYFARNAVAEDFSNRDFGSINTDTAVDNLKFLNQRLLEMMFPVPMKIAVKPGNIFIFLQELVFKMGTWNLALGTDYWHQGEERRSDVIKIPSLDPLQGYNVAGGLKPAASQLKVLGSLGRSFEKQNYGLNMGLGFDATVQSSGIGKDFTVALSLCVNF
jgi:hypothetical protein